jgi:hypothetical protein
MFNPTSGASDKINSLIPAGTLAFVQARVQEIKKSQKTGGEYAKLDLIVNDGEFQGRHIFCILMNPLDRNNVNEANRADGKSDGAKMGLIALTRMFEACRIFDAAKPDTYQRFTGKSFQEILTELDGQTIAIKVKVSKGTEGYEDKNDVGEYLSPNQGSGSAHLWNKLTGGAAAVNEYRGVAFGNGPTSVITPTANAPKQASNAPSWLKKPGSGM